MLPDRQDACPTLAAEIAVIVSHRSRLYSNWIVTGFVAELNRIGAPFDAYIIEDFEQIPIEKYKMCIFVCDSYLDAPQRRWIESLKNHRRWLVFHHATGLFEGQELSMDAMSRVIGMKARLEPTMKVQVFQVEPAARAMFPDLPETVKSQPPFNLDCEPAILIDDPEVMRLGFKAKADATTFALRKFPDWTSVYYGYPAANAAVIRSLARKAGVHIYNDADDAFYASRSFIGIHAKKVGKRTIALPAPVKVFDVFKKQWVGEGSSSFTLDLEDGATSLFAIGAQAEWCAKALTPSP